MAFAWTALPAVGIDMTDAIRRRSAIQPLIYGAGQCVFAVGFAIAGAFGMGRKIYGAEQAQRTLGETVGLTVMGIGGLFAVAGGILFLWLAIASCARSWRGVKRRGGTVPW
jgi:cytochrome c oxidase subunit I